MRRVRLPPEPGARTELPYRPLPARRPNRPLGSWPWWRRPRRSQADDGGADGGREPRRAGRAVRHSGRLPPPMRRTSWGTTHPHGAIAGELNARGMLTRPALARLDNDMNLVDWLGARRVDGGGRFPIMGCRHLRAPGGGRQIMPRIHPGHHGFRCALIAATIMAWSSSDARPETVIAPMTPTSATRMGKLPPCAA